MTDTNETQAAVTQIDWNAPLEAYQPAIDVMLVNTGEARMISGIGLNSHHLFHEDGSPLSPLCPWHIRNRIQAEKRNNALAVESENLRYIETVMAEAQEALCGNGEVCIDASGNDTLHIARGHLSRILAALEGDE